MDITVSSRDAEVTAALRAACEEKIGKLTRFLDEAERAEVHFFVEKNPRITDREVCEVTLEGRRHHLLAKAAAPDRFVAIDRVVNKLEHQIHKLKTKRQRRAQPRRAESVDSRSSHNGLDTGNGRADDDGGPRAARIVRTRRLAAKPMPPEEAAMQLELLGHEFLFFTNSENLRAGVVYRRADGRIGLQEDD